MGTKLISAKVNTDVLERIESQIDKGIYRNRSHAVEAGLRKLLSAQENADLADRHGAKWSLGSACRILGEIRLKTDPEEAAPQFEKAITILHEIKAENELGLAYSGMGRYHKQQGNTEQAREYLTKALEIFERLGTLIEPDKVRRELEELPQCADA